MGLWCRVSYFSLKIGEALRALSGCTVTCGMTCYNDLLVTMTLGGCNNDLTPSQLQPNRCFPAEPVLLSCFKLKF